MVRGMEDAPMVHKMSSLRPAANVSDAPSGMMQRPYLSSYLSKSSTGIPNIYDATLLDLKHHDLIDFLGLTQFYQVDLLPLTWQPALEDLGDGRTSNVSQSLLNIQMSLAFKRAFPTQIEDQQHSDGESDIFPRLCTELSVLAHPPLRNHPFIVQLEGFCWELHLNSFGVLPVFVFEKAHDGNLQKFMSSEQGGNLNFAKRKELCVQIAHALMTMHNCQIIHGDIKPTNVLMFKEHEAYTAKVADFGFSTKVTEDGLVSLPCSMPWYAPEYHPRKFSFAAAQRSDFFSFGMLCLWLLFHRSLLYRSKSLQSLPGNDSFLGALEDDSSPSAKAPSEYNLLESLKREKRLTTFAYELIESMTSLENQQKSNLRLFFDSTLVDDPEQRADGFLELIQILTQNNHELDPSGTSEDTELPSGDAEFHIAKHIRELMSTDYRVWSNVLKSLERHVETSSNEESTTNAAFQVAFCYGIGFGARRNLSKRALWLRRSQKDMIDLKREKEILGQICHASPRYRSTKVQSWLKDGYIPAFDFAHEFKKTGPLAVLKADYKNIAQDLEEELGPDHILVLHQKIVLCDIFEEEGNFKAAEEGLSEILFERRMMSTVRPHLPALINRLAKALRAQDKLDFAEISTRDLLKRMEAVYGAEHMDTLKTLTTLAEILLEKGEYNMAEDVLARAVSGFERSLGDQHISTLATRAQLNHVYLHLSKYEKLEQGCKYVSEGTKKTVEIQHRNSVIAAANQSVALESQFRLGEAREMGGQALAMSERGFGFEHDTTLAILGNLAIVTMKQRDYTKAESLLRQAIAGHDKIFGENNRNSLVHLGHLAMVYQTQKKYQAAEELHRRVVNGRMKTLPKGHLHTFFSLGNLTDCLHECGKYEDAIDMGLQTLEGFELILGKTHRSTLSMYSKLASIYDAQEDYDSARKMYHRVYEGRKLLLGADHAETIRSGAELVAATKRLDLVEKAKALEMWPADNCKGNDDQDHNARMKVLRTIALAMQGKGEYSEAGDLYRTLLFVNVKVRGSNHPDTLISVSDLGTLFTNAHKYADAERLHMVALSGREKTLGASHADTLYSMSSLADVLRLQGQHGLAESWYRRAARGREQALGRENGFTLTSLSNLAVVLTHQHELTEAQEIASRVLETRHRLLGPDHALTMASVNNLAFILRKQGSYSTAEELNRRNLDACERTLGDNHFSTLIAASNLVATLICRRDYKKAEKLNGRVLRSREELLGGEDPDTLKSAAIEARLLYLQRNFAQAEAMYSNVVEATERALGKGHPVYVSRVQELQLMRERTADPWATSNA